ncbi:MAG: hypothetical protein Q8Q15_03510 [bacterium]|nr:hypothetical protein [bacterium]
MNDILSSGSLPLLSLSYMPNALSRDGQVTSPPSNWNDWSALVQATIKPYSGQKGKNLSNVYYEVWNEPDLFGKWQIGRDPDYLLLYRFAAEGAGKAKNVNPFYFGGPATTYFNSQWAKALLDSKMRLDFLSWHTYTVNPEQFEKDTSTLNNLLFPYPEASSVKKLITDLVFSFEIKDGPDPLDRKYWGRWGLLTHESQGVEKKPRYKVITLLNQLQGERLEMSGEGTWVTGFAAREGEKISLILSNFDSRGKHEETVPVSFSGLNAPRYVYQEIPLQGKILQTDERPRNNMLTCLTTIRCQSIFTDNVFKDS